MNLKMKLLETPSPSLHVSTVHPTLVHPSPNSWNHSAYFQAVHLAAFTPNPKLRTKPGGFCGHCAA